MTAQDKRWVAYWKRKGKDCQHVWGEKFRETGNPRFGPMVCSKCGMPYYRWLQGSWYNRGLL